MNRLLQWIVAFFHWERRPSRDPIDDAVSLLRERHRRKVEGFNQALAAAANLRELLQGQLDELSVKEHRLQSRLQATAEAGDEASGGTLSLEIRAIAEERQDLIRRREEAGINAAELEQLRAEAIACATAELQEAVALAAKARYPGGQNQS